jgi:hypothetical protein
MRKTEPQDNETELLEFELPVITSHKLPPESPGFSEGRGYLGVILMRACKFEYSDALTALDYIRAYCKQHGYTITVTKDNPTRI